MRRLFVSGLVLLACAGPAAADAVLDKARASPRTGPLYAFDVDFADAQDRFRLSIDQSRPAGQRVVKIAPAVSTLKGDAAKTAKRLLKHTDGDIWCHDFLENIPANAARISETKTRVTFGFTPVPGKSDGQAGTAFKYLKGSATLDKATGAILAFEMVSPEPFKPMAAAKVDTFSMKITCKAAPDGRTHIDSLAFDLKGSAMMQPLNQTETRRVVNLKALPKSGFGTP